MRRRLLFLPFTLVLLVTLGVAQQTSSKPRISFDEFFNFVSYSQPKISPDGTAVVIGTERADWNHNRYRSDLWLWRDGVPGLTLLTNSGHDSHAKWSPDGKWVAFVSDRPTNAADEEKAEDEAAAEVPTPKPHGRDDDSEEAKKVSHVYVISVSGGEAIPVTRGLEDVHAFAWSPDSKFIYFATRIPWSKAKRDAYKKEWKDTIRYREQERGDVIAKISLDDVIARQAAIGGEESKAKSKDQKKEEETAETPGAVVIASTPLRVRQIAVSPDGSALAFNTVSVSQRVEGVKSYEIYTVSASGGQPHQVTNNQALEQDPKWSPDGKQIVFGVQMGSVEGAYDEVQPRVYSVDVATGTTHRWASAFPGAVNDWDLASDGSVIADGRIGTEVQPYTAQNDTSQFVKQTGWPGTYSQISTAAHSSRVAFVYSSLDRPTEVYIADNVKDMNNAKPITSMNKLFTERDLPKGEPFQWKTDDGTTVEGMLIYPPGKFHARNLRTFVLIHGGPADADGNEFGADWYNWAILAATKDWLVFRPNYRGSSGYGDKFMLDIAPHLVSRPGVDILDGIDALVKQGIADPTQISIGGYSYGGYMTNWLITQRNFKAAVTGAGAVEHAANWGNDDLTFDDAWYLGGLPWTAEKMYNDEAALYRLNKVKTPTHMVAGADDIRVSVLEDYLLERGLTTLGVPNALLIFPGEGHSLANNPWHGKIKVREELKWLEKYSPEQQAAAAAK